MSELRCPTSPVTSDGQPHTIIGCGSTNVMPDPDEPTVVDCLDCGMSFTVERPGSTHIIDQAANHLRTVDGDHTMGTGALPQSLHDAGFLRQQPVDLVERAQHAESLARQAGQALADVLAGKPVRCADEIIEATSRLGQ